MKLASALLAGVSLVLFCVAPQASEARVVRCANPGEVTAMRATAVQQELMDAALACGDAAKTNYNTFQTRFATELRDSDKLVMIMFSRLLGRSKGDRAYNLFKTELAAKAELRRLHNHDDFCRGATFLAAGALGPARIALADFVSDIPAVDIAGPVNSCVLANAALAPVPRPNPTRLASLAPAAASSAPPHPADAVPPAISLAPAPASSQAASVTLPAPSPASPAVPPVHPADATISLLANASAPLPKPNPSRMASVAAAPPVPPPAAVTAPPPPALPHPASSTAMLAPLASTAAPHPPR